MRTVQSPGRGTAPTPGEGHEPLPAADFVRIHGRDTELRLIGERLDELHAGVGIVIVIEGASGIGKSRLLIEAIRLAKRAGDRVGIAMAEPAERIVELSALLGALFDGSDPLLPRDALTALSALPEQRFWLLRDLQALLERAAAASPLVVVIDDAQWADTGSAMALRTLPRALAQSPIAWLVAWRRSPESAPDAAAAIDHLRRTGATSITLGPLPTEAIVRVGTELLGAEPDAGVLALVEQAEGNPFLVVEILLGLRDEGRIRVVDDTAQLVDGRLPDRVRAGMRERLSRLSKPANEAVTVAASLGRVFSFADLARTLGWQASALLAPVAELLEANLFVERGDRLAFWHDITREAVRGATSASARRALDRWAAEVLLQRGALPVEVAVQLADSAEPGDELAIGTLFDAAKTLLTTDPVTAARFGRRALEIAPSHHQRRGEIVSTTAVALHIAGNSDEAITFADRALRETLPAAQEAEVRLGIAGMFSISQEIRISAGRVALALPGLPDELRRRHLASLYHNLVTSGRLDESQALQSEADAAIEGSGDVRAAFTLHLAESAVEYADDRFGRAWDLVELACREGIDADDDQRLNLGEMWRGELLSVFDRYGEAFEVAADGLAAAGRDRQGWAYQMFGTWRGRLLFASGDLAEARATLGERFVDEDGDHAMAVLDAAGVAAVARVALHAGDEREVRRFTDAAHGVIQGGTPAVRAHAAWVLALYAMAGGDPQAARRWLSVSEDVDGRPILPRFPADVTDDVHLARIALAAGDDDLAARALASVRRRAELNPGVCTISGVEAHVAGLVLGRVADLERAVTLFETSPRRLALGSALEDHGAAIARTDRAAAVDTLSRALALYTQLGATWDAHRTRRRLRDLGVRRRISAAKEPAAGWTGLTRAELEVARLVGAGGTNRGIAERLFLSPHTVNSHVRHIFGKLEINSRVELARIMDAKAVLEASDDHTGNARKPR